MAFLRRIAPGLDSVGAQYAAADVLMDRGKYEDAARLLKTLSDVGNRDVYFQASVVMRLATSYMYLGRYTEAMGHYDLVARSSAKALVPEALLGLALATLSAGDTEKAYRHLREMEALYPAYKTHPRYMLPMGLIHWEVRRYESALEYLLRDDKNPGSRYFAGLCYRQVKRYAQASGMFRRITQEFPGTTWADRAQFELGETFYTQGDFLLAAQTFNDVYRAERSPEWRDLALYRLAACDVRMKDFASAEGRLWSLYRRKLNPSLEANVLFLLTESLAAQDKFKEIIRLFGRGSDRKRSPENTYRLIWAQTAAGDYKKAIRQSTDFLRSTNDPELIPRVMLLEAYAYDRTGKKPEAFASYQIVVEHYAATPYAAKASELAAMNFFAAGDYKAITTQVNILWRGVSTEFQVAYPETLYWMGQAFMKLKEYPEAQRHFKQFVTLASVRHPWMSEALRAQALAYALDRSEKEALPILQRAFQSAQETNDKALMAKLAVDMGNISFNAHRYEDAVSHYRRLESVDPDSDLMAFALFQEGVSLSRADYFNEAIDAWEKMAARFPGNERAPESIFRASRTRFELGRYAEAVSGYERLIRDYPQSPRVRDARLQIGQCRFNAGEFLKAAEDYQDFLVRYPKDPEATEVETLLQLASYQAGMSIEEIQNKFAGKTKPAVLADMYWREGAASYNQKDYGKAFENFQKILYEFPNSSWAPQAAFYRAECLFQQDKFRGAIGAYTTFLQSYPHSEQRPLAEFHLGVSFFSESEYARSAEVFTGFVRSYPNDALARGASLNAAISFSRIGDPDKTLAAYREYAVRFPNADDLGAVFVQLGQFLEKAGRESAAVETYRRVPVNAPEYPQALYLLAKLHRALGEPAGERRAYEDLRALKAKGDPYRIAGLLALADLSIAANDAAGALKSYQDVARNAADQPSRALAEQQIKAIRTVLETAPGGKAKRSTGTGDKPKEPDPAKGDVKINAPVPAEGLKK